MLLNMIGTIGINHFHLYVVLCVTGAPVGCYIATDNINIIIFYSNLNEWRTGLSTDSSICCY